MPEAESSMLAFWCSAPNPLLAYVFHKQLPTRMIGTCGVYRKVGSFQPLFLSFEQGVKEGIGFSNLQHPMRSLP